MSEYICEFMERKTTIDGWNLKTDFGVIQREEVIRCRDCKFCYDMHCNRFMFGTTYPDGFCAWGEER